MHRTFPVKVDQESIDLAEVGDINNCPICKALPTMEYSWHTDTCCDYGEVSVKDTDDGWIHLCASDELRAWLDEFHNGEAVTPITVNLDFLMRDATIGNDATLESGS